MQKLKQATSFEFDIYKLYVAAFGLTVLLFWAVRIYYWSIIHEDPFSDMANLDSMAQGVVSSWNFQWNSFWQSYTTPTLPIFRAIQISLTDNSMLAWRIFQAILLFIGTIWVCYEIIKITDRPWLALVFMFVIAISKPSIFWGYKLAREGLQEALSLFLIANFIYLMRTLSNRSAFILGITLAVYFLNRANTILIVPVVIGAIILIVLSKKKAERLSNEPSRLAIRIVSLIVVGITIVWSPWIIRSYNIYGHIVPLSTQGPYSFLWELGDIKVTLPTGEVITTDVNTLQSEAPERFPSDYDAHLYASNIVRLWFQDNWADYPKLVIKKITNSVLDRTIYLTKVSREQMFPNYINKLLLDKTAVNVILGIAGLFAITYKYSRYLWILPITALVPWLSATLVVGYPRMFEPSISLILFGNVFWVALLFKVILQHLNRISRNYSNNSS